MRSILTTAALPSRTVHRPSAPTLRAARTETSLAADSRHPRASTSTSCACGGTCPQCAIPGISSGVRLHPSAPEITTPLHARAVTIGQDIYFHPGQFQPSTPEGENLISHELAHTQQTRQTSDSDEQSANTVSHPGDALEENADALAQGETTHALAAPAGTALLSPFDNESPTDNTRRTQLLTSISNAEINLIRLLQTGGLVSQVEVAVERNGVRGVVAPAITAGKPDERFESYAVRAARLRRIIRSLMAMGTRYRQGPLPASLPPAVLTQDGSFQSTGGNAIYSGYSEASTQLQAAYHLFREEQGETGSAFDNDWYYVKSNLKIAPGAATGAPRLSRGVPSGAYMVFPDIDKEPLRYWHQDGFKAIPPGATSVEFWHDDIGYYYMRHDQRIDVPSPW